MARYEVPRPKRSDHTYQGFNGKWFDKRAYESAVAEWERGRDAFNESQRGSMMYGRSYHSSEEPIGASGEIDPRTGEGHATQYYDDGSRVSWDTDGEGESETHWTNQRVPRGKRNRRKRHTPPPHAK